MELLKGMTNIYLDNAATTEVSNVVLEKLNSHFFNLYGNPSSLHKIGIKVNRELENARQIIANAFVSVTKDEIIFTSSGTESNNLAIKGLVFNKSKKHLITSKIEHPSVLNVFKFLEKNGFQVTYLDVDENGIVNLEQLKNSIRKDTILVSIMHINHEIGSIQPIESIGKIIKTQNPHTFFHIDAVQSFGKFVIDPNKVNADLISVSSHKIHSIKGAGALYKKKNIVLNPLIHGGGQEFNIRSGTENTFAICAFAVAVTEAFNNYQKSNQKFYDNFLWFVNELNSNFKNIMINTPYNYNSISCQKKLFSTQKNTKIGQKNDYSSISDDSFQRADNNFNNLNYFFSPFILNLSFKKLKGEVILHSLENENIFVSTGAACNSKSNSVSHVLKALNLPSDYIDGTIRFSFSYKTTRNELEFTLKKLKIIIEDLSKYYK